MKKILKEVGPCKLKTRKDRFCALVDSIISQQISTAAATTIKQRLRDHASPESLTPQTMATHDLESLRLLGVSKQKAGYILDLTAKVNSGVVDLSQIGRKDDQAIIEHLTQVKGIGEWTAQMFLMFTLGRLDVFPAGDLGIQNAIKRAYGYEERPALDKMGPLAETWRPYRTIASWYLWRSLEVKSDS